MKRSSSIVRRICRLIVMFAVAGFPPSEFGGEHKAVALEKKSAPAPIIILDRHGRVVPDNTPSAPSQIFDVAVGANGTFQFSPSTVNISAGDTVRWTWMTGFHSVSSGHPCIVDSQFCSPDDMNCAARTLSGPGTVYQHLFAQAGTYSYFCAAHCEYGMMGVVNVCTPPPANMVSWWAAEGNTIDAIGPNNGTLVNGATCEPGEVGQAFSFNRTTDTSAYVEVPDSPLWHFGLNDFSIDFWVKLDQIKNTMFIHQTSGGSPGGWEFDYQTDTGQLFFSRDTNNASITRPWSPQTNTWYLLAVTRTAGTYRLYVNGQQLGAEQFDPNPIPNVTGPLRMGFFENGNYDLLGLLDEVEIFNRALSATEIQAITSAGSAGKCRPVLQLTAAASRKTHGAAETFDINLPLTGQSGVECRSGGASGDYTLVFTFSNGLLSGNAAVTGGTGTVSGSPTFSGREMIVNVTGVTNAQISTVTLSNVIDAFNQVAPNNSVSAGFLIGDTNGNRVVNAADVAQTKLRLGQAADGTNFRSDVNANGSINAADVAIVKANLGTTLPP
jgi:plastocyanin